LEIYKKAELWKEGIKFIEDKYQQYPEILKHHAFPPLKLIEFMFYKQEGLEEQSESCLNFLKLMLVQVIDLLCYYPMLMSLLFM
jgi:hypothetical protein